MVGSQKTREIPSFHNKLHKKLDTDRVLCEV